MIRPWDGGGPVAQQNRMTGHAALTQDTGSASTGTQPHETLHTRHEAEDGDSEVEALPAASASTAILRVGRKALSPLPQGLKPRGSPDQPRC